MPASEIKEKLHYYIDLIEDENQLAMLNEAAEAYATKQPDILDLLTPEQLERLEQPRKSIAEGKGIPHEEVMKMANIGI